MYTTATITTSVINSWLTSSRLLVSHAVTFYLKDGSNYTIEADGIESLQVSKDLMESNKISMGNCVPAVGDVAIYNTAYSFTPKNVKYYRISQLISSSDSDVEEIPFGSFYPDSITVSGGVTYFSGYDILKKFDKTYKSRKVTHDHITLKERFDEVCEICGIIDGTGSATVSFHNSNADAQFSFENLPCIVMPQQDFDTYRDYVACIAGACGCNIAAGRSTGTFDFVSMYSGTVPNISYAFPESLVPMNESYGDLVGFDSIRFRNYSKVATGTKKDEYDIELEEEIDQTLKLYKFGKNPFCDPVAMDTNVTYGDTTKKGYVRARNRIINQLACCYEFFSMEIPPVCVFDLGDLGKTYSVNRYSGDSGYHKIYVASWSYDGNALTIGFGDPSSGSSATATGGSGLGTILVNGKIAQAINSIDDVISDYDDVEVVKEEDSYLYNATLSEDAEDGDVLTKISSRRLHADKTLDVSAPESAEYEYEFEFPAVIPVEGSFDSDFATLAHGARALGVIPCVLHFELTTSAKLVGFAPDCTDYNCPHISVAGGGMTNFLRAYNYVHDVSKMLAIRLVDEDGTIYTLSQCSNISVTFTEDSKFKCGGWGGIDNGYAATITSAMSVPEDATTNRPSDYGYSDMHTYGALNRISNGGQEEGAIFNLIAGYYKPDYTSLSEVETEPSSTLAATSYDGGLEIFTNPDYSPIDATTASVVYSAALFTMMHVKDEVVTVDDIDENDNWVIPANHFELSGTVYNSVWITGEDGNQYQADSSAPATIHIIQPEFTIPLDIDSIISSNGIYVDLGYIEKDTGWFNHYSGGTGGHPTYCNYIPKWSLSPYSDGYYDWDAYQYEGNLENEAVQKVYLKDIKKFRKKYSFPLYLVGSGSGGTLALYDSNSDYQGELDKAQAVLDGDSEYYTNALADGDVRFVAGADNETIANEISSTVMEIVLQALMGNRNFVENNTADGEFIVVGSDNDVTNEAETGVLIGSNNIIDLIGTAILESNYGFVLDPDNDDVWVYFGMSEYYSLRSVVEAALAGGVTWEVSEDGTVITFTNVMTSDTVDVLQKTYTLSIDEDEGLTLSSDTGDSTTLAWEDLADYMLPFFKWATDDTLESELITIYNNAAAYPNAEEVS